MLRINLRVLACLVFVVVLCAGMISSFNLKSYAAVKIYYVATTGRDSYPGTAAQPFKTIQHAASVMIAGDTCYIAPGVYREAITPTNSGRSGAPISFIAQGSGVVISAADLVTGWTLDRGNVYKASMNWTMNNSNPGCQAGMDQVFVDGKMMIEARWPNIPSGVDPCAYKREYGARSDEGSYNNKSYTKTGISSLANPTGAYINEIAGAFWTPITGQVTSRTNDTIYFSRPDYDRNGNDQFYGERDGDYFYLWGKKVLLDSSREWFRDSNGQLYLWSPNGDSPSNYVVEAKKRDNVLDLRGKSNLTFKGIEMRGGSILTNTNTKYLTLDGVDVQYSAHYSIITNYWTTRGYGVNLQGNYTTVKNSHFANSAETVLLVTGSNCIIANNVCHDACYLGANGYVFGINNSNGSKVSNNTFYGSGTNACLDIRQSSACTIKNNDVFHGSRITCDGGMIMTTRNFDGKNTRVCYNFIHDGLGLEDGSRNWYGTSGFYSEGDVNNYIVDHNVIVGAGISLGTGREGPMTGWKVNNNTLVDCSINTPGEQVITNSQITNNIFSYLYYNLDSLLNKNIMTGSWYSLPNNYNIADPIYVSHKDYKFGLQSNSPAKDAGGVIAPYTDGYVGSRPDIGAFEYGKPAFVSGALITDNDIAKLSITYNGVDTFSISGAPMGRYLPENFKLKVGNNSAGGIVTMNYKQKTWTVTGVETTRGGQVYGQIGDNTPVAMRLGSL